MPKNAKKNMTFEQLAERTKFKNEKGKLFAKTFYKALAAFISIEIVYSITYMAFLPVPVISAGSGLSPQGSQTVSGDQTDNVQNPDSNADDDNNAPNSDDKKPVQGEAQLVGNNISVIVPYFISAHNKVKSSAKTATLTWKKGQNYQGVVDVGDSATLSKAVNSLMGSLLKEETPNTVYTGKDEIAANFPPTDASCNLKEADVKAAKCTEVNGVYIIQLVLNLDVNPSAGNGSGSVASILTEKTITDPVPKFLKLSNIKCDYQGARAECRIEKSTGNMTYYYWDAPLFLYITAANNDCKLGLEFEEKWDINW